MSVPCAAGPGELGFAFLRSPFLPFPLAVGASTYQLRHGSHAVKVGPAVTPLGIWAWEVSFLWVFLASSL